jgi:hypothetical protein
MEEYLIAEGWERGFMFNMALNVNPTLSFSKLSKGKYSQIFKIGFVKKKYPLDFNTEYNHVNGLDESCRSSITITGGNKKLIDFRISSENKFEIYTTGGNAGPVTTIFEEKNDQLFLKMTLDDSKITSVRKFRKK